MRHRRESTSSIHAPSLALAAAIATFAGIAAHAATPAEPRGGIGISIGTDLVVDRGFGDDGFIAVSYNDGADILDEAVRVAASDDGGYWLVGFHRTAEFADRLAISKFDANGQLDTSYGVGGRTVSPTQVSFINDAILVGDRFYLTGMHLLTSSGPGVMAVGCAMTDGTACPGFGDEGNVLIPVNEPGRTSESRRILHRDGALYAIGNTDYGNGGTALAFAKLDAQGGALDALFGDGSTLDGTAVIDLDVVPDAYDFAYAGAFASNGMLLIGGSAQDGQSQGSDGFVLALDPATGAPDTAFGDDGYAWFSADTGVHFDRFEVRALHVFDDGRILAGGNAHLDDEFFNSLTRVLLASIEPDGTPTTGFGVGGIVRTEVGINVEVLDMAVRPNGDIVVGTMSNGLFPNPYQQAQQQSILQFDANGNGPTATISLEYPTAGDFPAQGRPTSLLVDAEDRVLVAGARLWEFVFPLPDADHTLTRLVRDGVFADGFDP